MKRLLIILFTILHSSVFSQVDLIQSKNYTDLIFNQIDSIDANTWVVNYEFQDRIDTIKYFEEKNIGWISSYSKSGFFISKELFETENLPPPMINQFYSEFRIEETAIRKGYNGQRMEFPYAALKKRDIYYRDGRIKETKAFSFGKTECTTVTFDPETYKEIIQKSECMDRMKTGIWRWYDTFGKVVKEEDYSKPRDK